MRFLKSLAVTTAVLLGASLFTIATAPAASAAVVPVNVQMEIYQTAGEYGSYNRISAGVRKGDGGSLSTNNGALVLQRLNPGGSAWQTVQSKPASGYVSFDAYRAFDRNSQFRVTYTGGQATYSDDTYLPATTTSATISVYRKIGGTVAQRGRTVKLNATASPKPTKKAKFKIKVCTAKKKKAKKGKKGTTCTQRTLKKIKPKGQKIKGKISVPKGAKLKQYRLIIPGDANYKKTVGVVKYGI